MSRGKERASGSCRLRESMTTYEAVFDPPNGLLREKFTFLWETYIEKLLSWLESDLNRSPDLYFIWQTLSTQVLAGVSASPTNARARVPLRIAHYGQKWCIAIQ